MRHGFRPNMSLSCKFHSINTPHQNRGTFILFRIMACQTVSKISAFQDIKTYWKLVIVSI